MVTKYHDFQIVNLNELTCTGNLENFKDIGKLPNCHFVIANILNADVLKEIFQKHGITDVIHLAAEFKIH